MITEINEKKNEAAVFALSRLGGEDIINQMKMLLDSSDGFARFRIIRVLNALGDPEGKKLLRTEILDIPALRIEAASLLAREGDVEAAEILRQRLKEPYDATEKTLLTRVELAMALYEAG